MCILSGNGDLVLTLSRSVTRGEPIRTGSRIQHFRRLFFALSPSGKTVRDGVGHSLFLTSGATFGCCGSLTRGNCCGQIVSKGIARAIRVSDIGYSFSRCPCGIGACTQRLVIQRDDLAIQDLIASYHLLGTAEDSGGPRNFVVRTFAVARGGSLRAVGE